MGGGATYTHACTVAHYRHLPAPLAPMTFALRKAAGISSRRRGDATGRLAGEIGEPNYVKGQPSYGTVTERAAIRFGSGRYSIGENYPDYTIYLEKGWTQQFTPKQAAFLTYKLTPSYNKSVLKQVRKEYKQMGGKGGYRNLVILAHKLKQGGKLTDKQIKARVNRKMEAHKNKVDRLKSSKFNYALFLGLLKRPHHAPPREFNYLNDSEVIRLQDTVSNSVLMLEEEIAKEYTK